MNNFKEWLSDYLRYFLLVLALLLMFALAVIGFRVYKAMNAPVPGDGDSIEILTETERLTEPESETEQLVEFDTEAQTTDDHLVPASKPTAESTSDSDILDPVQHTAITESDQEPLLETEVPDETEVITEETYEPVYKTLKGSCYIRSGPSMEADIIGEYMYGTTVEFLEDVGGWYKVQIDGMIGYMGARFF